VLNSVALLFGQFLNFFCYIVRQFFPFPAFFGFFFLYTLFYSFLFSVLSSPTFLSLIAKAIFIALLIVLEVGIVQWILPFASISVSLSFIFGNSVKLTFESFVVLFIMNPFHIGDTFIFEGETYIVDEIALLKTTAHTPRECSFFCFFGVTLFFFI
jgi:hypothetical protein